MFLAAWQPLPSRSLKNNIRMFFFRLYWSNVEVQFKYDKFLSKELWTFNFVKHFKLDWKTRIYAFCCENISVLNYAFFGVTFWTQIFIRVKNWHFETLSTWSKNLNTLITKYWWKFHFVSTASGALVVGGVRDICIDRVVVVYTPEIGLSVQWSTTNQSVAVCGSLW